MRLNTNQKPEFAGGIEGESCVRTRSDDRLEGIANGKSGVESDPAEVESTKSLEPGTNRVVPGRAKGRKRVSERGRQLLPNAQPPPAHAFMPQPPPLIGARSGEPLVVAKDDRLRFT